MILFHFGRVLRSSKVAQIAFLPCSWLRRYWSELTETSQVCCPLRPLPPCELVCLCDISLLWLHGLEVGNSYCCSLTVTVPVYFTLGGCCGVVILLFEKYFTLGGCSGPERELLLFESDGSLGLLRNRCYLPFDSGRLVWT